MNCPIENFIQSRNNKIWMDREMGFGEENNLMFSSVSIERVRRDSSWKCL